MEKNLIGAYGAWAKKLVLLSPAKLSFRNPKWNNIEKWRLVARKKLMGLLALPKIKKKPRVELIDRIIHDGLSIEKISWKLPYGPPTKAIVLKPQFAKGKLPGVLALHDHGANFYFGAEKITDINMKRNSVIIEHQQNYGGKAWANELARHGYIVLVHDVFMFGSRRLKPEDVPEVVREGIDQDDDGSAEYIRLYNDWAMRYESIVAKSLFCSGITLPGVCLKEDLCALDILCEREDVDPQRIGCGGLSVGGLRTVFLAGTDSRIRCAVCTAMMTTWHDYLLSKNYTHTWIITVPFLSQFLEFPEILALRVPLPTLVQNNIHDPLFTLSEVNRAETILKEVYEKAQAKDYLHCSYYPGSHKFDLKMQAEAFQWFNRWLM